MTLTSPTQTSTPPSVIRHWYYDANNRLDHQTQPESGTTTYHYDGLGRPWYQVDALGRQSTNTYDDENRLTDVVTSPVTDYWVHADYDEWGNRVQVQNGYVNATFEYDLDLRLTRRTDAINSRTFESRYAYDPNDRLKQVWYPSGNHVAYDYDHDRLLRVYDADPQTPFATGFDFHPSGGLASYTTGNGIVHAVTYDARYRPAHITGSGSALDLTYHYDGVGNILQIDDTRQNMTSVFHYDDALDRLTSATGKKYQVHEYLITDGTSTQEVLYWYQLHGRRIAGDYEAKLYTLADSIRYGRTDAALVRIITRVNPGEDRLVARNRETLARPFRRLRASLKRRRASAFWWPKTIP